MTLLSEDVFTVLSLSEKRLVASLCSLWGTPFIAAGSIK